jgi:hypothetical protein
MKKSTSWLIPGAAAALLSLSSCGGESRDPVSPSLAAAAPGCSVTVTYANPKTLNVPRNTANLEAAWFIRNTGATTITLTSETRRRSGRVIATHNVQGYPYTMPPGWSFDTGLLFDTGAAGTGTTGMTITANCGSINLPDHLVNVT